MAGTIGASGAGIFSNYFGRRFTIIVSDLFLIAGPIIMGISIGSLSLIFGRLIVGVGVGINMMMGPLFLQESAPLGIRSRLQPTYFFAYFIGLILSYLCGIIFPNKFFPLFGLAVLPAIVQIVLMAFTQTDPTLFYAKKGSMILADRQLKSWFSFNCEESNSVSIILVQSILGILEKQTGSIADT
jgi:MFS family permease